MNINDPVYKVSGYGNVNLPCLHCTDDRYEACQDTCQKPEYIAACKRRKEIKDKEKEYKQTRFGNLEDKKHRKSTKHNTWRDEKND